LLCKKGEGSSGITQKKGSFFGYKFKRGRIKSIAKKATGGDKGMSGVFPGGIKTTEEGQKN